MRFTLEPRFSWLNTRGREFHNKFVMPRSPGSLAFFQSAARWCAEQTNSPGSNLAMGYMEFVDHPWLYLDSGENRFIIFIEDDNIAAHFRLRWC